MGLGGEKMKTYSMKSIVCVFLLLFAVVLPEMRGRVKIENGNVVADNGSPLRGTPFFQDFFDMDHFKNNKQEYRDYLETVVKTYHMNAIRISPWIGDWENLNVGSQYYDYNKDKAIDFVDTVVDWCEELGVYAILNMHTRYGTEPKINKTKDFWNVFAPRYKNKTHVVYEVINEPNTENMDSSEQKIENNMDEIYHHVRSKAPYTHLILWTPANASFISIEELESSSSGANTINYDNASFGFHVYEWTIGKTKEWDHAEQIRNAGFPVICTEFFSLESADYVPIDYEHVMDNIRQAEGKGMSWFNWAPTGQYKNNNKTGWTPSAINFSQQFFDELNNWNISDWPEDTGGDSGAATKIDISSVNVPTSLTRGQTVSVTVQYETTANREIAIALEDRNDGYQWYGSARTSISAGSKGTKTLNFTVSSSAPQHGNYQIQTLIVPSGAWWSQREAKFTVQPVTITGSSSGVGFNYVPGSFSSSGSSGTVYIDFNTGGGSKDIVVSVFDGNWNWKGEAKQTKSGTGTAGFNVPYNGNINTGKCWLKVEMRPVGGSWQQAEDEHYREVNVN